LTARIQLAGMALAALLGASPACTLMTRPQPLLSQRQCARATLTEYRQHLVELNVVVAACAKARDTKSCDPALVGRTTVYCQQRAECGTAAGALQLAARAALDGAVKDETPEKAQDKAIPRTKIRTKTGQARQRQNRLRQRRRRGAQAHD